MSSVICSVGVFVSQNHFVPCRLKHLNRFYQNLFKCRWIIFCGKCRTFFKKIYLHETDAVIAQLAWPFALHSISVRFFTQNSTKRWRYPRAKNLYLFLKLCSNFSKMDWKIRTYFRFWGRLWDVLFFVVLTSDITKMLITYFYPANRVFKKFFIWIELKNF